ncbi:hypothetical protein ACFFLZ_06340 [Photobacterium aphoticum]|uniref:Uncharacterized protein n=1 Tax=Photobacterium aphoticum TaxID=754436 RepID=A0A0J1GRB9_9GAMM|nr:hypothetical protein [Photobacterium aphoticum]KLV01984.1 hypothetical protein ABT58_06255 [Photobacterium aphoticum]
MEKVKRTVSSPIHKPCPDMAGTANFDKAITEKSLDVVKSLRKRFGLTNKVTTKGGSDFRYSRPFQVQARRALMAKGGLL